MRGRDDLVLKHQDTLSRGWVVTLHLQQISDAKVVTPGAERPLKYAEGSLWWLSNSRVGKRLTACGEYSESPCGFFAGCSASSWLAQRSRVVGPSLILILVVFVGHRCSPGGVAQLGSPTL